MVSSFALRLIRLHICSCHLLPPLVFTVPHSTTLPKMHVHDNRAVYPALSSCRRCLEKESPRRSCASRLARGRRASRYVTIHSGRLPRGEPSSCRAWRLPFRDVNKRCCFSYVCARQAKKCTAKRIFACHVCAPSCLAVPPDAAVQVSRKDKHRNDGWRFHRPLKTSSVRLPTPVYIHPLPCCPFCLPCPFACLNRRPWS